ncbi:nitroreductase family protein [Streptomyces sp. SCA3-4]|uniref:nitroreductase family protein n=1 Tax=Streptomyces sichuanensis TaxID=2871810 RepID=UPI001CE26584|nr:nitroreductase family protein [Streptomyces sichuanensis]MCA6092187.1 nitroreductase family protein [Streptomyces sichuanensis]
MTTRTDTALQFLAERASCRDFTTEPLADSLVDQVLDAAVRAPTAFNFQPYSFIVVRDPGQRAALARIAGGQRHVVDAPVFVVVCADLRRIEELCDLPAGRLMGSEHPDALMTSVIDASMAGMCATLAAEALGLGAVMVGGIRNDPGATAGLLDLPPGVFAVFGLCLGRPAAGRPAARPRLRTELLVHRERYDGRSRRLPADVDATGLAGPAGDVTADDRVAWRAQITKGARSLGRRRAPAWRTPATEPVPAVPATGPAPAAGPVLTTT